MAEWPKFLRYIDKKTKYPKDAKRNKIEGKVYVHFIVDKEGNIMQESVRAVQKLHESWDKEAVRVIKTGAKRIPGLNVQTNEKIETKFVLPISFRL